MTVKTQLDRFQDKVSPEPNTGCWLWIGALNDDGYGTFQKFKAHRFSFETFIRPIPAGLEIDHLCRQRCCVNPQHLEPVTKAVNQQRGLCATPAYSEIRQAGKRAKAAARTLCKHGHILTPENTSWRGIHKDCRRCMAATCKRWRMRRDSKKDTL